MRTESVILLSVVRITHYAGGRLTTLLVANTFSGTIADIDFNDTACAYYMVVEKNKPFEQQWKEFKIECLKHFIKPHIVFITPLVESPKYIDDFLYAYGAMFSTDGVKTYG